MSILDSKLEGVSKAAVMGHIRPDGDCVGSCLGLYNYLLEVYPQIRCTVYLEPAASKYGYLKGFDAICSDFSGDDVYDLCICLDGSDRERFGTYVKYLDTAKDSLCIDHHITNAGGFTKDSVLEPDASSTCEVLYGLLDSSRVSRAAAECIYTGIIHDTGVFRHSCTSSKTMRIAGELMDKGIDFGSIIDGSFFRKTYIQNQVLGRALLESVTFMNKRCIFSVLRKQDLEFYGVDSNDMDGIVDQLRVTEGVECAIFMYEVGNHEYKVSMRANGNLDVSRVAGYFGGGGHVRAAGCMMSGSLHDVVNNLSEHIAEQMNQEQKDV